MQDLEMSGFSGGIVKERWSKGYNGRTFTFGKDRESQHFVYFCQYAASGETFTQDISTRFRTDRDLTHEDVEQRQQFVEFMNRVLSRVEHRD